MVQKCSPKRVKSTFTKCTTKVSKPQIFYTFLFKFNSIHIYILTNGCILKPEQSWGFFLGLFNNQRVRPVFFVTTNILLKVRNFQQISKNATKPCKFWSKMCPSWVGSAGRYSQLWEERGLMAGNPERGLEGERGLAVTLYYRVYRVYWVY